MFINPVDSRINTNHNWRRISSINILAFLGGCSFIYLSIHSVVDLGMSCLASKNEWLHLGSWHCGWVQGGPLPVISYKWSYGTPINKWLHKWVTWVMTSLIPSRGPCHPIYNWIRSPWKVGNFLEATFSAYQQRNVQVAITTRSQRCLANVSYLCQGNACRP